MGGRREKWQLVLPSGLRRQILGLVLFLIVTGNFLFVPHLILQRFNLAGNELVPHPLVFLQELVLQSKLPAPLAHPVYVIPGGQSIGIVLCSQGVVVVRFSAVVGASGEALYPARERGVQLGDVIIKADGEAVGDELQLAELIDRAGREGRQVGLEIKRGDRTLEITIPPLYCWQTRRYRVGLMVSDGAVGVGTLTYYDPGSKSYGALGHMVMDTSARRKLEVERGNIVLASVQDIEPARKGQPGEKIGVFLDTWEPLGTIERNTPYGIFGIVLQDLKNPYLKNPYYSKPIPVASRQQVHPGPATLLTVVNGEKVEKFEVVVEKVFPEAESGKGMIIRVTDPRLVDLAGGIVQGMSGSPIIQEGRLIGAITHVFVNDPLKGYAVYAEFMVSTGFAALNKSSFFDQEISPGYFFYKETNLSGNLLEVRHFI